MGGSVRANPVRPALPPEKHGGLIALAMCPELFRGKGVGTETTELPTLPERNGNPPERNGTPLHISRGVKRNGLSSPADNAALPISLGASGCLYFLRAWKCRSTRRMIPIINIRNVSFRGNERKGLLSFCVFCALAYEDCIALARLSASCWYIEDFSSTFWER